MARTKKKQKKSVLPLLLGSILLGALAAALSVLYLKNREAAIRASLEGPEVRQVAVVVATADLPKGTTVTESQFAIREIPEDYVPVDAITPDEFNGYTGRVLVQPVGYGKPLLKSYLSESFPVDFSDLIPKGHRAMTVTVDEVNSVAGNIRPGNHIDIYVNIPYNESGFSPKLLKEGAGGLIPASLRSTIPPELLSKAGELAEDVLAASVPGDVILPVVQNVRVLATGQDPYDETLDQLRQPQRRTERNFTSVTLDLTPDQAALLNAAEDKGDLLALLRNRNDDSLAGFTTLSARDLFNNAQKMAREEQRRKAAASRPAGVDADGNLVNANGEQLLSKEQLAAAGLRVNENGEIVDASGKVVNPDDLVVGADGKILSKAQLAAAGLSVNENGEIVDADGNVIDPAEVVVGADGAVYTKSQLAAAGLSVNENGEIVDKDGNVVSKDDLIVGKNGSIISRAELAKAGLRMNEKGEIVDKDGNVVSGQALAQALGRPELATESGFTSVAEKGREAEGEQIDLIVGGASEDGVAKVKKIPVEAEE
ncbi:MAG: Flp pilus assembly protein CpaB [Gammaproteobacteria bacterium]|nr:MAG: Flp pilus assembly protein CpaB [Gammaproteobacteria bacterium]